MSLTRTDFEIQLDAIRSELLEMGTIVDNMVGQATEALTEQDVELAEQVIANDDNVDALDIEIEASCMRLIALQAPVARDLRLLGTAMKVITDLERIGDHAVDIAKVSRKLSTDSFIKPLVDIPRMSRAVREMLRNSMSAFVNHDLSLVDKVVEADDEIDLLFHKLRDELHQHMRNDAALVVQASYLLFVAHYLERIADHTVNIAERVYFAETGNLAQLALSHKTRS